MQALLVVVLGRGVAPSLVGQHVDHDGAVEARRLAERVLQAEHVVAVDGADVAHAEALEEGGRLDHLADGRVHALEAGVGEGAHGGQHPQRLFQFRADRLEAGVEADPGQALRQA